MTFLLKMLICAGILLMVTELVELRLLVPRAMKSIQAPKLLLDKHGSKHGEPRLLVHTPVGSIQGVPADDGDYAMFLGIPYAKVNVSNPFGASIPHEKFENVLEAFTESGVCPQIREVYTEADGAPHYDGSLYCLTLNIYIPNTDTKDKAVYLYVYGGNYDRGIIERKCYGPKYLVRHDVIVVNINYRLGPYGFMCIDIPEIPGNQGLRDQYDAIKWVRDNIRAFGGDPGKITLGGHSSGSIVVDMHLLTKRPRMFQQAVLQSGTATTSGFLEPSDKMALVNIAGKLGFKTNDTYAALSFLAKASPRALITATHNEYRWNPCIEKEFEGVIPFIDENPELSKGTNIDGLNILGGFTDKECLYCLHRVHFAPIFSQPDAFRYVLGSKFNLQNDSGVPDILRQYYVDEDGNRETKKDTIVDFLSDFYFVYPMQRELMKYTKHKNTTVYMYMFSYNGQLNKMKRLYKISQPGATHADELGYIFTMYYIPDKPNGNDQRMIDRLTTMWTNFMKYGNPTPVTSELLPVIWPPLTDSARCLQIDTNLTVISRPFRKNMALWDLLYDTHLDKLKHAPAKNNIY